LVVISTKPPIPWATKAPAQMNIFPVKHVANADAQRLIELVAAADLTTASNTRAGAARAASTRHNVGNVKASPSATDVAAHITTGPDVQRRRRRYIGRGFPRQIGS